MILVSIFAHFGANLFCLSIAVSRRAQKELKTQYNFFGELWTTETIEYIPTNPEFRYSHVHYIDCVTEPFIEWLESNSIRFHLYTRFLVPVNFVILLVNFDNLTFSNVQPLRGFTYKASSIDNACFRLLRLRGFRIFPFVIFRVPPLPVVFPSDQSYLHAKLECVFPNAISPIVVARISASLGPQKTGHRWSCAGGARPPSATFSRS